MFEIVCQLVMLFWNFNCKIVRGTLAKYLSPKEILALMGLGTIGLHDLQNHSHCHQSMSLKI